MKRIAIIIVTAIFPFLVIIGVALFPLLLRSDSKLSQIAFFPEEQSEQENALSLYGHLGQDLPEHETLWLYAENAEIQLWVNGQFYQYHGRGDTPPMFQSPGSGWYGLSSPGIAKEDLVKITVRSYYGENGQAASSLLKRLYAGDGGDLYRLILQQTGFFSLVLICALIAGMIYLVEGAIDVLMGVINDGIRIGFFGFYCFSGGIWCVTDDLYPYLTLLIAPTWLAAVLDMTGLLLLPIALAAMIRYYIRGERTRKIMNAIVGAEIMTAAVSILLQFMGIADLMELQIFIGAMALGSLAVAIGCIVIELWRYRDRYLLLLLLTVLPVFIGVIIDGMNLFWAVMPRRMIMGYSFGASVLVLILQLASYAQAETVKAQTVQKLQKELADSQISIMLSQIKPHFLYNALTCIKQLCDSQPTRASEALAHFAHYLRGNLYAISIATLIPFEKELEHVSDYLYLEKMRFGDRVQIQWEIGYTEFFLPALTLQPIVENAIRHGLNKRGEGGTLTIRSEKIEGTILLTVIDDGVGFDPAASQDAPCTHIGLNNVEKRIAAQCKGCLKVESAPEKGTRVMIMLPQKEDVNENACSR